jgi:hypothetical protein
MTVQEILEEKSDLSIKRGNQFEGFLGHPPEYFTKEQLIMICNVLCDNIEELRCDVNAAFKILAH